MLPGYSESHNGAPKRSNSGREILYVFPQPGGSAQHPQQLPHDSMPIDVQQALELLRNYSFRDVYRWLKTDRQDEINRSSISMNRPQSSLTTPQHAPRMSMASSAHGSSRASSIFSAGAKRISVASTNTQYSHVSDPGQQTGAGMSWEATLPMNPNRHASLQTAQMVNIQRKDSATLISSPVMKSARPSMSHVVTPPRPTPRQRESDVEAKKKYFCTACNKGFARKYDWKVHEQRYHEQQTQYPCPDCNQILFAETLFKSHHRDAHGCQDCPHAKGIAKDVDVRRKRTAWGCGFCGEFLDDWEKRCDHVAAHYDNGVRREEWDHSKVIVGLLRQPDLEPEWRKYLLNRHGHFPSDLGLRFSKETTGRSHGDHGPQLQDLLEFGACPRMVSTIVQLAYEQGYRRPSSQSQGQVKPPMSPPYAATQETISESPEHPNATESPAQFVTSNSNQSPMDAFGEMSITPTIGLYHTSSDSQIESVGSVSGNVSGALDWSTLQVFQDQYPMQSTPLQQNLAVQHNNASRMSISYDKPLPSIPPKMEVNPRRGSTTPRPQQHRQHSAGEFLAEQNFGPETWSLVGSTLVDDPNPLYFTHEHSFG